MNKKLLSILFTLFFAFAVNCQNADKTGNKSTNNTNTNTTGGNIGDNTGTGGTGTGGTGGTVDSSKGIEQFEGNTYRSDAMKNLDGNTTTYQFLLIRNGKVAYEQNSTQDIPNVPDNTYYEVEGTGTDYTSKNTTDNRQKITLKFSSDGSTVTLDMDGLKVELKKI